MSIYSKRIYTPKRFYRGMDHQRAEKIRKLYFVDRMKQVDIAKQEGMAQGSISRIISEATWQQQ